MRNRKDNFLDLLLVFNVLISAILVSFSIPRPILDLTGEFKPNEKTAYFHGRGFDLHNISRLTSGLDEINLPDEQVLGDFSGKKRIFIDLSNQRLYAFQGNRMVYNFLVSTGKWGRTPTGKFNIWVKLRYTTMSGGSRADNTYYYLPNVPYTMYFYNRRIPKHRGYGIHGTYWHNNFGHPMSHGCINMRTEEAAKLYYWAKPELKERKSIYASRDNPGTSVIIFGKAPSQ